MKITERPIPVALDLKFDNKLGFAIAGAELLADGEHFENRFRMALRAITTAREGDKDVTTEEVKCRIVGLDNGARIWQNATRCRAANGQQLFEHIIPLWGEAAVATRVHGHGEIVITHLGVGQVLTLDVANTHATCLISGLTIGVMPSWPGEVEKIFDHVFDSELQRLVGGMR